MSDNWGAFAGKVLESCARVTEHRSCCFAGGETEARRCRGSIQWQSRAPCAPPGIRTDLSRSFNWGRGAAGGKLAARQAKEKISAQHSSFLKEKRLQGTAQPGRVGESSACVPSPARLPRVPWGGQVPARPLSLPARHPTSSSCNHPPGFPQRRISAAGVSSPAMPLEPAVCRSEVLARSAREFPLGALSARGGQCIFLP